MVYVSDQRFDSTSKLIKQSLWKVAYESNVTVRFWKLQKVVNITLKLLMIRNNLKSVLVKVGNLFNTSIHTENFVSSCSLLLKYFAY